MPNIIVLFLMVISTVSYGQTIENIIHQNRQHIERVELIKSERVTYISSNFANPQITTINLRDKVNKLAVIKVYYVYTAYKRSLSFDQKQLDRERFEQLMELYPILFENNLIEWEILEQTGLETHTDGDGFFHGFILVHRLLPSDEGRQKEFDFVSRFLNDPSAGTILIEDDPIAKTLKPVMSEIVEITASEKAEFEGGDQALLEHIQTNFETPSDVWKDRKDFWAKFEILVDEKGNPTILQFEESYGKSVEKSISNSIAKMPPWTAKNIGGIKVRDTVAFEWRVSYSPQLKGQFLKNGKPPILSHKLGDLETDGSSNPNQLSTVKAEDIIASAVYKALDSISKNENLAVVMDVTGSMANHIISTSYWLNQHINDLPFSSFTAFNDGDDTKDNDKIIGATGGIYFTTFVSEFSNSIRTAMQKGNGGDYPENDIEAILYAIRKDAKATGVLLIADNFSTVKDFELLEKINLQVNILPCGLTGSINQNYLDIAFNTKGKIYYNEQVIDLQSLKKGDSFKVRRTTYVLTGKGVEVVHI